MTSLANQWNEVYKLAPWKRKNNTKLTTLRKPDGSLTADIRETLQHMLEYFVPEDKDNDETDFHTQARTQSREPVDTVDAFEEIIIEKLIEEFHEVLMLACSKSFRTHRESKRATSIKSSLVDRDTNSNEEKIKRAKTEVPKDDK